jgi:hypothetical protein
MSDTQTRKYGDTPILSGVLSREEGGDVYPADVDWVGAVGKINIVDKATPTTIVVDHGTVTLTAPVGATLATYRYQGAALLIPVGKYLYEIEVTFTNGVKLTWPNDKDKNVLVVIEQFA